MSGLIRGKWETKKVIWGGTETLVRKYLVQGLNYRYRTTSGRVHTATTYHTAAAFPGQKFDYWKGVFVGL